MTTRRGNLEAEIYQNGNAVVTWHGNSSRGTLYIVRDMTTDPSRELGRYAKRWQADNHALFGCPCPMQWHYYNGKACKPLDSGKELER